MPLLLLASALLPGAPAFGRETGNLLRNPSFEEDLAPAWEKRTPGDAARDLERVDGAARPGRFCLALEAREPVQVRLRQGHDRSLKIAAGSLVELTAWIRLDPEGHEAAGIQFYCMGEDDTILAQPVARAASVRGAWEKVRLLSQVPPGTLHCMAYLQIQGGAGRALFDDVHLRVLRAPQVPVPPPRTGLLTDLAGDDGCLQNLRLLLGTGWVELSEAELPGQLIQCEGAVVIRREGSLSVAAVEALTAFAQRGGRVFADLRAWAAWQGLPTAEASLDAPAGCDAPADSSPVYRQMQTGLRVSAESPVTAGFLPGQIVPYAGKGGRILALGDGWPAGSMEVLAVAPGGRPALVRQAIGQGQIVAADLLSLDEPYVANVEAYYKYLFVANALAKPASLALAEYYPRKLSYAAFVERMRETAGQFPAIDFHDEGPAGGNQRIYSLNLGRPGAPLYFLYAAAHGSEWEPAYGLLTFAKRLAQGRLADAVDLDKVSVKIVPMLNPAGYELGQRQNLRGVDLNRQGDYRWDAYRGRDSNGDGRYGPSDSDWKGELSFSEPESQTYRRIIEASNLRCILDFHGNSSGSGNNKVAILPATACEDNLVRAFEMRELVNRRLQGRYVLRQSQEKTFTPYLLESIHVDAGRPLLMNTAASGRYGLLVELTAGYADSYGTVLQTEVTCEVCRALFLAYPAKLPVTRKGD